MNKSPITLGLTSATLGLTLAFPTFAEADFFKDSKADLEFRNFYFNSDYRQPNASHAMATSDRVTNGSARRGARDHLCPAGGGRVRCRP